MFEGLDLTAGACRTLLLGPNGAGKTTLMRLAIGLLRPRIGAIDLGGVAISRRRGRIGYMPQQVTALDGLRLQEQVAYAGWLRGSSSRAAAEQAPGLLDRVGLLDRANDSPKHLSGGQLRRLGIAQALAGDVEFLMLDEPTAGLDPAQKSSFRRVLTSLPKRLGIVISTHDPDELEELFDHVIVINQGRVLFDASRKEFLALGEGSRPAESAYVSLVGADSG